MEFLGIIIVVAIAIFVLKGFDRISGRGPKQVRDGIKWAAQDEAPKRVPCPLCAEMILPQARKCPHCQSLI